MLIVYAAVAGQSIVKLYAAAMLPGFFLTFLYLAYIVGWALINPKIAPRLRPTSTASPCPTTCGGSSEGRGGNVVRGLLGAALSPGRARDPADGGAGYPAIVKDVLALSVPVLLTFGVFVATWWYVVVHNAPRGDRARAGARAVAAWPRRRPRRPRRGHAARDGRRARGQAPAEEKPQELGAAGDAEKAAEGDKPQELGAASESEPAGAAAKTDGPPEEMTSLRDPAQAPSGGQVPSHFYPWFWGLAAASTALLLYYYWRMDGEQLQILKELVSSVVPLGVLTVGGPRP